jgi:hypothetical protein
MTLWVSQAPILYQYCIIDYIIVE